ncbi:MAG: hypothetical protein ACRDKI_11830 [Solirubrobacterales bacterium]
MKQFGSAVRLLAIAAVLAFAALVVTGCGSDNGGSDSNGNKTYSSDQGLGDSKKVVVDSDKSFDAQQQQVVDQITAFGDATASKNYKKLCGLLSTDAQKIGGDCVKTFEKTGAAITDFKLSIKSVDVAPDGKTAKASVAVTSNSNPKAQTQNISLAKEGGEWKIQILGN